MTHIVRCQFFMQSVIGSSSVKGTLLREFSRMKALSARSVWKKSGKHGLCLVFLSVLTHYFEMEIFYRRATRDLILPLHVIFGLTFLSDWSWLNRLTKLQIFNKPPSTSPSSFRLSSTQSSPSTIKANTLNMIHSSSTLLQCPLRAPFHGSASPGINVNFRKLKIFGSWSCGAEPVVFKFHQYVVRLVHIANL